MGKIEVFCNPEMVALLEPIRQSAVVLDGYGNRYLVAEYYEAQLEAMPEQSIFDAHAFWRHTSGLNIEVEYDEEEIAEVGLISHIWNQGISSDRHVAGAIADLARDAGMSQIQFMTWAAQFVPERIQF